MAVERSSTWHRMCSEWRSVIVVWWTVNQDRSLILSGPSHLHLPQKRQQALSPMTVTIAELIRRFLQHVLTETKTYP